MKLITFLSIICLLNVSYKTLSQPGTLDKSFGKEGKVITGFTSGNPEYHSSILQNDDKIVSAGASALIIGEPQGFIIVRYSIDGKIDSSFGENGQVITDFNGGSRFGAFDAQALAIQPDNKIVAAGEGYQDFFNDEFGQHANENICLARYLPDGALDLSFGDSGKVFTDFGAYESGYSVAVQADGKIVVGGTSAPFQKSIQNFLLVRYLPNGTLDESFGDNGKVITDLNIANRDIIRSLALQPDDKIVAAGNSNYVGDFRIANFALARYNLNGSLDATFGTEGIVITDFSGKDDELRDIALQPDGKIVAVGYTFDGLSLNMALSRYKTDGTLDESFDRDGKLNIFFEDNYSRAESVVLQPDGKIIAGGFINPGNNIPGDFALLRLQPNGNFDSSFGNNGKVSTDLGGDDNAYNCLLQEDGKIILAGETYTNNFETVSFALARYNGDRTQLSPITRIRRWIKKHVLNFEDVHANSSTAYYTIEQSSNGVNGFSEIARITNRSGISNASETYTYNLTSGTNNESQTNFYRIGATDRSGVVTYSDVIEATNDASFSSIHIYPNPVKDVLHVSGLSLINNYELIIMNEKGTVLKIYNVSNVSVSDINVSGLKQGNYYLLINSNNTKQTLKFVKE